MTPTPLFVRHIASNMQARIVSEDGTRLLVEFSLHIPLFGFTLSAQTIVDRAMVTAERIPENLFVTLGSGALAQALHSMVGSAFKKDPPSPPFPLSPDRLATLAEMADRLKDRLPEIGRVFDSDLGVPSTPPPPVGFILSDKAVLREMGISDE